MGFVSIDIVNAVVILNSDSLRTFFGLAASNTEIPVILGIAWTPAAASTNFEIAWDHFFDGSEASLSAGKTTFNVAGRTARKRHIQQVAQADFISQPLPIITPFAITRQLALRTDNAGTSIIHFDFAIVAGQLHDESNLEKLAERRNMDVDVPAAVPYHKMDDTRGPRRMGDRISGT